MPSEVSSPVRHRDKSAHEARVLSVLTSAEASQMLSVALAHRGVVRSWNVHAIHHRPGAGVSVGYSVVLDEDLGAGAWKRRDTYIVATSGKIDEERLIDVEGRTLSWQDVRVHVWEHPYDPQLPALERACDQQLVQEWMGEEVDIELVSYRPTRRAVVKILPHRSEHPIFGKVVEPRQVSGVVSRMQMLERAGVPAPRLVRFDEQGLVVSSALPGMPLNKVYASVVPENLARMRTVLDSLAQTLDSLPLVSLGLPARPAWADRCEHYAQAAAIALPEHEQRATRLAHQIREILSSADMGPVQPTHGDFYEANIFIDPRSGQVSGILDVDNLGPGYRVHDWGCLLGHMSVLGGLAPKTYQHIDQLLADWTGRIACRVEPEVLGACAAGVVLSLVSGARRSRRKNWQAQALYRLGVAEQWLK
ncbi:aminoglycoside phosphotransferase family protein [Arcanobacterium pinnipediorum]|uniref:Aminoglycoside phosphotransferase family protein n=1 Tax=Arcanobacterium pinnipediorum TaxID=1503041 RepID=A0ABY5AGZ1_9ACTO|nr:aminoglycoside phosphotransferase family protein [Arcanobacterium pinnipediorum]USR79110.1 aminoglycoside phosphotransferase family protein [Arcanobacterium pinnipediorum]